MNCKQTSKKGIIKVVLFLAAYCIAFYNGTIKPVSNYLIAAGKYFREYDDERDQFAQYSKVRFCCSLNNLNILY